MSYKQMLNTSAAKGLWSCLGLDIDPNKIPLCKKGSGHKSTINSCYDFLVDIIENTAGLVAAYKPNLAFYEQFGSEGWSMLGNVVTGIKNISKDVLIIGDGKRGDIDNTNAAYMETLEMFDSFTIAPYLGGEANKPFFFDEAGVLRDKLVFVLCQTSNKGAEEFQGLSTLDFDPNYKPVGYSDLEWLSEILDKAMPLYQRVAKNAINWSPNVGLVTGATYPGSMKAVRNIIGDDRILLIPGIGSQAGSLEASLDAGMTKKSGNVLINVSRSALYKSNGEDFAQACRGELIKLNNQILEFRQQKFGPVM